MKKAGGKGWTDFQSFLKGPEEEEKNEWAEPTEGGGEPEVGDLLGSYSSEAGPAQAPPTQGDSAAVGARSHTSYGSTDRGTTGSSNRGLYLSFSLSLPLSAMYNLLCRTHTEPPEPSSPSWDDPSWGSSSGWEEAGQDKGDAKQTQSSGTKTRESDSGWGESWGWDTADIRTAKSD